MTSDAGRGLPGQAAEPPEFSRVVDLDRVGARETAIALVADAGERAALARRFGLASLDSLTAELRVRRLLSGMFRLTGTLRGEVVQHCVVTLEPVPAHVEESFVEVYSLSMPGTVAELEIDPLDDEAPEPLSEPRLDVGEVVAQYLSLGLPPYPRAPGAKLDIEAGPEAREGTRDAVGGEPGAPDAGEPRQRPFGALASLRRKD